jgi:hypothetical protein
MENRKKLKDLWDSSIFWKPISLPKLIKRIDRLCERANKRTNKLMAKVESDGLKSEAKIKSEKIRSINNSRNLPDNVTIREEYVKCGKSDCSKCKHGPYYYAYWKDNGGNLKKKYIGKYHPPIENTNKAMGRASSDTVADPSNSPEVSHMAKGYISRTKNVRATRPRTSKLRQDQI